jgi:predicted 2-oxoglutarate/Fe(II)-dependent dioxygenase YbiX
VPSAAYFDQFGIHHVESAFSPQDCAELIAAAAHARSATGMVWNPGSGDQVSPTKRRTEFVDLPPEVEARAAQRIETQRDAIEARFDLSLGRLQPIKLVRYDPGDFYGMHNDVSRHPEAPETVRARRLSVVVFLNEQVDDSEPGCYSGGRLTFHGLVDEPPWNRTGHPLDAEPGLMVLFPPETVHEVTPVTSGARFTLVTWFQ